MEKDVQVVSSDLLATPPIFTLQPGGSQIVRVGLRGARNVPGEVTYRLSLREVPSSQPFDHGSARGPAHQHADLRRAGNAGCAGHPSGARRAKRTGKSASPQRTRATHTFSSASSICWPTATSSEHAASRNTFCLGTPATGRSTHTASSPRARRCASSRPRMPARCRPTCRSRSTPRPAAGRRRRAAIGISRPRRRGSSGLALSESRLRRCQRGFARSHLIAATCACVTAHAAREASGGGPRASPSKAAAAEEMWLSRSR